MGRGDVKGEEGGRGWGWCYWEGRSDSVLEVVWESWWSTEEPPEESVGTLLPWRSAMLRTTASTPWLHSGHSGRACFSTSAAQGLQQHLCTLRTQPGGGQPALLRAVQCVPALETAAAFVCMHQVPASLASSRRAVWSLVSCRGGMPWPWPWHQLAGAECTAQPLSKGLQVAREGSHKDMHEHTCRQLCQGGWQGPPDAVSHAGSGRLVPAGDTKLRAHQLGLQAAAPAQASCRHSSFRC